MNNTTCIPWNSLKLHTHQGFWLDIFPIVRAPKSKVLLKVKKSLLFLADSLQKYELLYNNYELVLEEMKINRKTIVYYNILRFFNLIPTRLRQAFHSLILKFILIPPKKGKIVR